MADVNDLLVRIDATTEQLRRELKRAEQAVDTSARKIDSATKRMDLGFRAVNGAAMKLAGAFGIAFGARGLLMHIGAQLKSADEMLKLTQRIGGTTEALSELQHVANLSGVAWNQMTTGLQRMTRRLAEAAQGTGEARGALRELGLDARELVSLSLDQQFEAIADRIVLVTNESDRVRLAMKLFDSEGVALVQTMQNGAAGIREMREEARRLGLTLSQDQAQAAANARDELERMKSSINALSRDIITSFAPALTKAAEGIREMFFGTTPSSALSTLDQVGDRFRSQFHELMRVQQQIDAFASSNRVVSRDALGNPRFKASAQVEYNQLLAQEKQLQAELNALMERRAELEERQKETLESRLVLTASEEEIEYLNNFVADLEVTRQKRNAELNAFLNDFVAELNSPKLSQGQRLTPELSVFIEQLREGERLEMQMRTEAEKHADAWREAQALFDAGVISEQTLERVKNMNREVASFGSSLGRGLQDSFVDMFMGVETSFTDMLKRMSVQLVTSQLFSFLAGLGGPTGRAFSFLGFGQGNLPTRHSGGPVNRNHAYKVKPDEEVFIPAMSGNVVPINKLGGGGIGKVDIRVVNNTGVQSDAKVQQTGPSTFDVIINAVGGALASGKFDPVMRARYGSAPVTGLR